MTNLNLKKQATNLNLVNFISSSVLMMSLLVTVNVSAGEFNLKEAAETRTAMMQNKMIAWSDKVNHSLNEKIENKLQNIIVQAENKRLLDSQTRNMLALIE